MQAQIIQAIPQQQLGSVATILATIDWLISKEADYITGQTISLNGGLFN
jgi:NAD(P)-dependent dehydrogenase (short-subunit alcohol dehydrogenase family)